MTIQFQLQGFAQGLNPRDSPGMLSTALGLVKHLYLLDWSTTVFTDSPAYGQPLPLYPGISYTHTLDYPIRAFFSGEPWLIKLSIRVIGSPGSQPWIFWLTWLCMWLDRAQCFKTQWTIRVKTTDLGELGERIWVLDSASCGEESQVCTVLSLWAITLTIFSSEALNNNTCFIAWPTEWQKSDG